MVVYLALEANNRHQQSLSTKREMYPSLQLVLYTHWVRYYINNPCYQRNSKGIYYKHRRCSMASFKFNLNITAPKKY